MTLDDVRNEVKSLEENHRDDESAHCAEDGLYCRLLQAIADGTCEDPPACAAEALKTQKIDFARWCA